MRFSKKAQPRKSETVDLSKGARLVNCTRKDRSISVRKGLRATGHRVYTHFDSNPFDTYLEMTDCYIYDEGELARVAIIKEENFYSYITFRIKLIFTDGRVKDLSEVTFSRTDYNLFGRPESFTVFSGEPTIGSGIYFMARRVYEGGFAQDNAIIYELSDDKTMWRMLSQSDFYSPTLLANGRGNAYRAAELAMGNFEFPSPVYPQSANLLSGGYKAYFTADSYSYYFKLPHPCTQDFVACRFNHYGIRTDWIFYYGENYATAEFDGQKITAVLSREEGSITFKGENSLDYPLPYDGSLNNLLIEATAAKKNGDILVASKKGAVQIDAGLMSEGSAVTAFWGGWLHPAAVVFNSPLSPLYFPADELQIIGEESTPVLKLAVCTDSLVAIRRESIYTSPIKGVTLPSAEPATSSGAGTDYLHIDRRFETAVTLQAPPLEKSIVSVGSKVYFVDDTGKITSFSKQGKSLSYHGQAQVSPFGFGIVIDGNYGYICEKTVFFATKDEDGEEIWQLPETMEGGFTFLGKTVLVGHYYKSLEGMFFTATFTGTEDTHFSLLGDAIKQTPLPPKASIELPLFEGLSRARKLFAVRVDACADNLTVGLTADGRCHPDERFYMSGENNYILCGDVARSAGLTLTAEGNALIKGVSYEYREMNKM